MKLVYIGRYTNTHGLKGEIKIISDFEYKDKVFEVGNNIIIDNKKYTINSYRVHKGYDMVMLDGIKDINDIELLKGSSVYIDNDDYNFEYVYNDLIGFKIYDTDYRGDVVDIIHNKLYSLIKVRYKNEYLVPFTDNFIIKVDLDKKIIYIKYLKGLYDED